MKVGIFTNPNKDKAYKYTNQLIAGLSQVGINVIISSRNKLKGSFDYADDIELAKESDMIITLGGDGTILKIVGMAARFNTPILGINLGDKGFMTTCEKDFIKEAIANIVSNNYSIIECSMLKAKYQKDIYYALNEVMVGRARSLKLVPTEIYINDHFYYSFKADGVLISTPTGSTAYSLSAGGPILSPGVECFTINGICPHSLYNRAVVISQENTVRFHTLSNIGVLMIDGVYLTEVAAGSDIIIEKAEFAAKFVRFGEYNFYNRLMTKLNTWSNPTLTEEV